MENLVNVNMLQDMINYSNETKKFTSVGNGTGWRVEKIIDKKYLRKDKQKRKRK